MRLKVVPMREILFAAKMGFLSKPLWLEFFASRSRSQNARNWNKLSSEGYFQNHDSKMLPDVLVLAKKSLDELNQRGVLAVTKPHLGLFDHDLKVSKIVLNLKKEDALEDFTSEAELKKKFMVWMKTTHEGKGAKFPDLTLVLKGVSKFKRVAIEVEQSVKGFDRYKQIMANYATAQNIDAVVFVSDNQTVFNRISRAMKETNYPSWERPVGFGELFVWLSNPLRAPIYLSRDVESLHRWMNEAEPK